MNYFKNFFSHLLSILFFIGLLLLSLTCLSRELITYDNVYESLEDSKLLKSELNTNSKLRELKLPEEIYNYIEIEEELYGYFTNRFLLEAKLIDKEVSIDKDNLNKNIAIGLEKYIDDKLKEKDIDINETIDNLEIEEDIKIIVKEYALNKTKIDLENNEYITDHKIKYIEKYADEIIEDIKDSTYVYDIIDVLFDNTYTTIYIIVIVLSLVLIALINLNIIPAFSLAVIPLLINVIIYIVIIIAALFINIGGSYISLIINSLLDEVSVIAFKYFTIILGALLFALFSQLISKLIYGKILKKKGITTEDNVLDDYDEIDKKEES